MASLTRKALVLTSAACSAAVGYFWVRSVRLADFVTYESRASGLHVEVRSVGGKVEVQRAVEPRPSEFYGYGLRCHSEAIDPSSIEQPNPANVTRLGLLTIEHDFYETTYRVPYTVLSVPHAAVLGAFLVLPALYGFRAGRREIRRRRGLCSACGYDLRASPGICPECGAESRLDVSNATA